LQRNLAEFLLDDSLVVLDQLTACSKATTRARAIATVMVRVVVHQTGRGFLGSASSARSRPLCFHSTVPNCGCRKD